MPKKPSGHKMKGSTKGKAAQAGQFGESTESRYVRRSPTSGEFIQVSKSSGHDGTKTRVEPPPPRVVRDPTPAASPRPSAPQRGRSGRLREALALMDSIPEPEGTDAAWEAVERGIEEARQFPGRES